LAIDFLVGVDAFTNSVHSFSPMPSTQLSYSSTAASISPLARWLRTNSITLPVGMN